MGQLGFDLPGLNSILYLAVGPKNPEQPSCQYGSCDGGCSAGCFQCSPGNK
jgi:hypothetical protein